MDQPDIFVLKVEVCGSTFLFEQVVWEHYRSEPIFYYI